MAMACLSDFTIRVYGLLIIELASSAFGKTRGIITLLNFCIPHIPIYHSCYSNESLIFKIKNQCNAIEIHYKAKPVIQNKERAKIEIKSSYKKEDDKKHKNMRQNPISRLRVTIFMSFIF